jgi:hypothetical protein
MRRYFFLQFFFFLSLFLFFTANAQTLTSPGGEYIVTQTKVIPISALITGNGFSVISSGDPIAGSLSGSSFSVESIPPSSAAVTQSLGSSGGSGGGGGGTVLAGRGSGSGGQTAVFFGQVGDEVLAKAEDFFKQLGSALGVISDQKIYETGGEKAFRGSGDFIDSGKSKKYAANDSYGSLPYDFQDESVFPLNAHVTSTSFPKANSAGWWFVVLISALGLMGIVSRFWFTRSLFSLSSSPAFPLPFSSKKNLSSFQVVPVTKCDSLSLISFIREKAQSLKEAKSTSLIEISFSSCSITPADYLASVIRGFQGTDLYRLISNAFDSSLRVFLKNDGEWVGIGYVIKRLKDNFNPEVLEQFEKGFFRDLFLQQPLGSPDEFHAEIVKGKYLIRSTHFPDGKNAFDYGMIDEYLVFATSHEVFVRILDQLAK